MIHLQLHGEIAEIRIQHEKELNLFSMEMTRELARLCDRVESDDRVAGVLLWGGEGRSFSAGGDFADLRRLKAGTRQDVAEYLHDIVLSYQALLGVTKPVVAAVDHHAIGQGLQVALMCDWRVGSERSLYHMPELANGVPCPLGSAILEAHLGRGPMLRLVVGCERLDAEVARAYHLVDEVCPHRELEATARERLERFCAYPRVAYRVTKKIHSERMIRRLDEVDGPAAEAHATSYLGGAADDHFSRILGR